MLNAVVLLLTLPSLLMPPGMCVCRLASVPKAPVSSTTPTPAGLVELTHAASPRPDCSCESCRVRTEPSKERESPRPGPSGPTEHAPGCPAAAGALPLSMVVPVATVIVDLVATLDPVSLVLEPVAEPARVRSAPSSATSPPLFLAHYALLI